MPGLLAAGAPDVPSRGPVTPPTAQEAAAPDLFELVWTEGAGAAIEAWSRRPPAERDPGALVSLADQLLWSGRADAAGLVLEFAEARAPGLARVPFEQGRTHLQRGEHEEALGRFVHGARLVERDTTLTGEERASLARRFANRIGFLERREELVGRNGAYRTEDGELYLFKFDPYIHTFPAVLHERSGEVRILYPGEFGLEWRDEEGATGGRVRFEEAAAGGVDLVMESEDRTLRAASLGIVAEPIRVRAGGTTLGGTLFRPSGDAPVPAAVLTHGAGLSTRYNLVHEALAFAAAGVAALVYDKPGLGESEGANWLLLSIDDQVEYVLGAVRALRARPDIGAIGAWGFSQGGWVAPLAAIRSPDVAFVVIASGASVGPQAQATQAVRLRLEGAGLSGPDIEDAVDFMGDQWALVSRRAATGQLAELHARAEEKSWGEYVPRIRLAFEVEWWAANDIDAGATLEALAVPTLALFGADDAAVPPRDNAAPMLGHLARAPTDDYAVMVLPGADHQFTAGDGLHPLYLRTMRRWIADRFVP